MKESSRRPNNRIIWLIVLSCSLTPGPGLAAAYPADKQQWSVTELLDISTPEPWAALGAQEQHAIINFVWASFLGDGGAAASVSLADFLRLADRFLGQLDGASRSGLRAVVENRIGGDSAGPATLGVWDVWRMRRVAKALGIENLTVATWTLTCLNSSGNLFTDASSTELGLLMDWTTDIEQNLGVDMSPQRRVLLDHIIGLPGASTGQNPTALYTQLRVLGTALNNAGEKERPQFARQVMDLVQQNREALYGLTVWNIDVLRKTATAVGIDRHQVSDWTLDWLLHGDTWMDGGTHREINALYGWVFDARTRPLARKAEQRLTAYLRDRLMVDPGTLAMTDSEGMGLARVIRSLAPRLDPQELEILARHVADRVAEHPSIDGYHWNYESIACLFDSPQLRQDLRNRVEDAQGKPNVQVARLVTWMQRGTDEAAQWRNQIQQKAQDEQLPAGQRALWLLIRADAASPVGLSVNDSPDTRTPRMWAEQALALAPDETTRMACVKWIAADDLRFNRLSESAALLTQVSTRFAEPANVLRLEELQRKVSAKRSSQ